jgi:hypothetical protein
MVSAVTRTCTRASGRVPDATVDAGFRRVALAYSSANQVGFEDFLLRIETAKACTRLDLFCRKSNRPRNVDSPRLGT